MILPILYLKLDKQILQFYSIEIYFRMYIFFYAVTNFLNHILNFTLIYETLFVV